MCGGSPLFYMTGRFTGEGVVFYTLVLPSLNRMFRRYIIVVRCLFKMTGRYTGEEEILILSFSPLSFYRFTFGAFPGNLVVGEKTQGRIFYTLVLPL